MLPPTLPRLALLPGVLAVLGTGSGCIQGLTQVAGTGVVYHTRCSADMRAEADGYFARCTPEACTAGFTTGPVSHVVVALDGDRKIVGYAERICFQDLSDASGAFDVTRLDEAQPAAPAEASTKQDAPAP